MHTPRFSGQPINAGDFVLTRTFSRPMRTNCENVGTVVLFIRGRGGQLLSSPHRGQLSRAVHSNRPRARKTPRGSRKARRQKCARAHSSAERSTANPEIQPARNSVRTPRGRTLLLASVRRGLLGFAGLAPHSGRSSVPFRLTMFRDRRYFPSNPST